MKRLLLLRWLRNVSIPKKLYFTVGIMGLLIMIELGTLSFAINALSSVRAYVGGEGLWSKAQKDAAYSLQKYGQSHNEKDYDDFKKFLAVPLGDKAARTELEKKSPDFNIAQQGFLEGRLDPADIDGVIKLFRRFRNIYYINKAIGYWSAGDTLIAKLLAIGEQLHNATIAAPGAPEKNAAIIAQIELVNDQLTHIEDDFSYTLGEGSRWLENLIFKLLFGLVLTVEIFGLSLTILVSRGISKGLNEIITSTEKVAGGDLKVRAKAYSGDEIGVLANAFNEMTEKLDGMTAALTKRNVELEQFTHIVSHNLRSQITTLMGLTGILDEYGLNEEDRREAVSGILLSAQRLDQVLKDLNNILRVKNKWGVTREAIHFPALVEEIEASARAYFANVPFTVITDFTAMDECYSVKSYFHSIFYNLISNGVKYRNPERDAVIKIKSERNNGNLALTFRDNGMGLDVNKAGNNIFGLYKRFHPNIEGNGAGLFMVKTQVETLGGRITISSREREGTEFRIELPLSNIAEQVKQAPALAGA